MKQYIKKTALLLAAAGFLASCSSDFLNEDLIRQESTQSFESEKGLDQLSVGMYANFRIPFTYDWCFPYWQLGTDEMTGGEGPNAFNDYSDDLNASTRYGSAENWDHMYAGIGSANILIKNVPLYYNQNSAHYNTRLGEGYFMRGYNYFRMVMQFGGVPLLTEPVAGAQTEFVRSSTEETYAQLIADLKEAYKLLPETNGGEVGRLTKYAAAHFVAKACLFRASELNDSWNGSYKEQDLNDVIEYGKKVIEAHPLCANFVDLWDYTKPDGPNESVSEVVLSAQFSDLSVGRTGNQVHLFFLSRYQTLPGMARDIAGGREYRRLRTTNYSLDVYDRVNDSRFWKSFVTVYSCNNPKTAPKWTAPYVPEGKVAGEPKFGSNEPAVKYIVNDAGDTRYTPENLNYYAPSMYVRYFAGEKQAYIGNNVGSSPGEGVHGNYGNHDASATICYVSLSKWRDGSRPTTNEAKGRRDAIIARSAEDYLMVAEAYIRKEQYGEALPYINALRQRAGYANGEDRSKNIDGGQAYRNNSSGSGQAGGASYSDLNTYFESNNIEETTASTKEALQFASVGDILNSKKDFYDVLGANSDKEKMLVFILNERSRELLGELIRWPDLARTKQLEKRYKVFNDGQFYPGAAFNPNKHYLRPLPQSFLDAVTKDGKALSSEEKQAMQNPGW
ncbi:hypothetical protein M2480_002517 [Parabacteroides sp. PFB2-12]|uniref:RagB/SusD family nutrient uptake outer membrane protein n=1 Tax=unclassified Parabacteroides TaxID=2649774 RepID=UPI0024739576|nr:MULTISPECIES: RagB/SusD family nutrient uptake outer membrane protein [unclassified Parabacteroides]MDH6343816.1 hypothetical protein [Parabacteroides sp. PM6-13]MDH6391522.1 hypothetical protein [Parabacteroides sp. PFB2-12]